MADLYEDYGLEVESDEMGAEPQLTPQKVTVVKKGGVLGKVVALTLGFVIGAGGVIGGVAGAGYMVASKPIKETVGTINNLAGLGINYTDFITEDYASKTVIQLVGVIGEVAKKFTSGEGTLGDLNNISPLVSTALDPVLETMSGYGVNLDKNVLLSTPVGELPDYLMEVVQSIELSALLNTAGIAQTPLLNAICHDEDGYAITIGDIMNGGPEALLANIPLEALLISEDGVVDPDKDALIMALVYGNTNRYEITSESTVAMKQMEYSLIDGVLYDINHEEVLNAVLGSNGIYTVTEDDEVYYVAPNAYTRSVVIPYYAYKDAECTKPLNYKKTMVSDLMGGDASDLFNNLELGTLFSISPLDEDADPITLALAYGEEGTHYEIVNNNIVWIGNNKARTIGDLLKGDFSSIINELKLGTLLDISPLDEYTKAEGEDGPDPLMLSLAYGEEGTHYEIVQVNGEYTIEWKVKDAENGIYYSARTLEDLMGGATDIFEDIQLGTILQVDIDDPDADRLTHALAYGYEGEHFEIDNEGKVTWLENNKPRTVADIMAMSTILETLRLATVLGVEIDDPNVDALTHALAYGYEGEHFEIDNEGKVTWLNGNKPKTVNDMTAMGDILNTLRIATVLGVEIDDPNADALTHALAFGYEGENFEIDVEGNVTWLNDSKPKTVNDLSAMGATLETLRLATVLGVEIDDPNADAMTHALAFGYEGEHFEIDSVTGVVTWLQDGEGNLYAPRTVNDMSTMGTIINDIRLETALGITYESPRLLHALAYGSEGDGFNYIKNGAGEVIGIEPLKHNTIASLSSAENNIIDTLKLKDILGEEAIAGDLILSHLGEATLDTLPDTIATLTFKQVYPEQIYETRYLAADDETELSYDSNTDLYFKGVIPYYGEIIVQYKVDYVENVDGTVEIARGEWPTEIDSNNWVSEEVLAYHVEDGYYHIEGQTDYQVHLKLTSQWKYLLVDSTGEAHDYKMTEFAYLVENMTHNMTTATLYDLNDDGIVTLDGATLQTKLITKIEVGFYSQDINFAHSVTPRDPALGLTLGDLTVTQIMDYTGAVLQAINDLMNI